MNTRYKSRFTAGEILAQFVLNNDEIKDFINNKKVKLFVFTIPNGGVPIAEGFCQVLDIKYDILIVRKIKIPYNTEAGFGSITTDGTILINDALLSRLNLSKDAIDNSIKITKDEIEERIKIYKKTPNLESRIKNQIIFIMDDGLASGFTMLAAITMIKKYNPLKLYVSVPTAPQHTIDRIKSKVDNLFCPNIKDTNWFAVADAYQNWYDVPELEVMEIIKSSKYYIQNF